MIIYSQTRRAFRVNDIWLTLSPNEDKVFRYLLDKVGCLVSREELCDLIFASNWREEKPTKHHSSNHKSYSYELPAFSALRVLISRLRDKTGDEVILTVDKYGYVLSPGIEYTCPTCGRFK